MLLNSDFLIFALIELKIGTKVVLGHRSKKGLLTFFHFTKIFLSRQIKIMITKFVSNVLMFT